jgi:hypothetical protein
MRVFRVLRVCVAGLVSLFGVGLIACDTGAAGIEACRQIEAVRCEQAPVCFGDPAGTTIQTEDQVANCKTFYQDHCLVGTESATDVDQDVIDACTAAIEAAAKCKTKKAKTIGVCDGAPAVVSGAAGLTPCEVLADPENLKACKFVASTSTTGATTDDTTASSGGGGSGGGG